MHSKKSRIAIDISMVILLPMLMAYALIGEVFHEAAGSLMFILFIAHNIINRRWYAALLKGRYNAERFFRTILNLSLLLFMFIQPVSGILMSKHLYTFIAIPGISATAREVHLVCAYWGFVLLCMHAGTHLTAPLERLKAADEKKRRFVSLVPAGISAYGVFAFIKRGLADYMFRRSAFAFFDYNEPGIFFFLDYLAIMILFAFAGYLIMSGFRSIEKRKEKDYEGITG